MREYDELEQEISRLRQEVSEAQVPQDIRE
jgi:hypothetical protein